MTSSRLTRAVLGAAGALAASAALAMPASAASLVVTTTDCGTPELSKPFAPWGDQNDYKLVDGGSFTDGAPGWKLTGNAEVENGRLTIPAGSSAVSAPVCVGHAEPTLRFFARGAGLAPTLTASVQFQLLTGTWLTVPIGVDTGSTWNPSTAMQIIANQLPPAGEYTAVKFVFAPLLGEWQLDDVYVDPRGSN